MRHEPKHPITKALLNLFLAICSEPDSLDFIETFNGKSLDITMKPHMKDIKILIGKKGKTIIGTRHVASVMGKCDGLTVSLEARDSFIGDTSNGVPFQVNPEFKGPEILPVLTPILLHIYGLMPSISFEDHGEKLYVTLDVPREDLTLIKAIGVAFYPYGYRNGRKLSFRVLDYHPEEEVENADRPA